MAAPLITAITTVPNRENATNQASYSNDVDTFFSEVDGFQTQANAQAQYLDGVAAEVDADAATALSAKNSAVAAANYKGDWEETSDVKQGESYSYLGKEWIAKQDSLNVTPVEGDFWIEGFGDAVNVRYDDTASSLTATNVQGALDSLGTSATLDATLSNKDSTAGRVLRVGDGGWFGNMISYTPAETGLPSNSALLPTAAMYLPDMNAGAGDFCLHIRFDGGAGAFRLSNDVYTNNFFLSRTNPSDTSLLSPPVRIFHSGDIANDVQLEAGVDNARIPTALTLNDAGFGFASKGMYWQVVSPSRALNVTYTNTSKNSIGVSVQITSPNSSEFNSLNVNGVAVSESQAGAGGTYTYTFFAIVPPSGQYIMLSAVGALRRWSEFKL